nr:MAG TPA: hypothetical protein [Caudoviricetes sp.]
MLKFYVFTTKNVRIDLTFGFTYSSDTALLLNLEYIYLVF